MILWFLACTTNEQADSKVASNPQDPSLVMAMVAFDYSVGSLALFDLETETLSEDIASISGDPVVVYEQNAIWQLNRYQYDTLRKYSPTNLQFPEQEVSLASDAGSTNPHDTEVCANNLFVSLFGTTTLPVLNPDTLETINEIDISQWADGDGIPEASSLVEWNDTVFVGLARLDRNNGFSPKTSMILQFDCASFELINNWEMGTNIRLIETEDNIILVTQGDESHDPGVLSWNPDTTEWDRLWTTQTELSVVAFQENRLFYASLASDMSGYQLNCVDVENGAQTTSEPLSEYVTDLWIEDQQTGWMGTHWGWVDAGNVTPGLSRIDLATCSTSQFWPTQFAPFSIAFVPAQ